VPQGEGQVVEGPGLAVGHHLVGQHPVLRVRRPERLITAEVAGFLVVAGLALGDRPGRGQHRDVAPPPDQLADAGVVVRMAVRQQHGFQRFADRVELCPQFVGRGNRERRIDGDHGGGGLHQPGVDQEAAQGRLVAVHARNVICHGRLQPVGPFDQHIGG
jgi:hypothetical protein